MRLLLEAVRWRSSELWPNDWILYHDNVTAHKALSAKQFLAQKSITGAEHPPCFPDLSPNVFWLLTNIEFALKGRIFQVIEDIP
jgi:hypothetical protein